MEIAIFLIIVLAIGLIFVGINLSRPQSAGLRMPGPNGARKFRLPTNFFLNILPFTRGFLEKSGIGAKLKSKIDAAHLRVSSQAFFNIKLLLMIIGCVATVIIMGKVNFIILLLVLGGGYLIPDIYLNGKLKKRKAAIVRVLPETIDLLGLCIEAGLDFSSSVRWVIDKTPPNPMLEELGFVLEEIKWGKPRIQALKDMSRRLDISEINSFVQTIIQAERMGTPVAEAFTILSEDARAQRFHRGERIALKAPIKILLPLIFFIMPVIGIVIGGPILLQFMQGGLGAGLK
ncbi:MAG: hypothetical protein COT38_02945 [Candidatus Omnitrophica bacterium CG08_land_8_20_14_0_20_41_16]|uniref:Type II secretion system protein GspF domain-containing protein n=1 Tax=Candidatus Sherwoodlollariibacterium unditelluris TaxID=1974757 RepID=A0A2G9YIZ7_9BACT|nr:MAG: hypothetical protein COX41_04045 [Candidatus Omnitrophica bacterium CG23_combo_of_CG06-09_8_20_14_all_41_10]PIS33891.1 MAG: hypothetical protein COT38_02945 [Candidatus Omnitrophica bacterium CG08_land_8_20_14_0_20_41_16]